MVRRHEKSHVSSDQTTLDNEDFDNEREGFLQEWKKCLLMYYHISLSKAPNSLHRCIKSPLLGLKKKRRGEKKNRKCVFFPECEQSQKENQYEL